MRNFEKIYLVIRFQLSQSLKNKRVYLGFALGLAMILRTAFNYLAFTGEHSFCVAEATEFYDDWRPDSFIFGIYDNNFRCAFCE